MLSEGMQYLHEHDITPQNPRAGLVCRIIDKSFDEKMPGRLVKHKSPSGALKGKEGARKRKAADEGNMSRAASKAKVIRR
jgi:hypothetical protein